MTIESMKNSSKAAKKEIVTAFRTREILGAARQIIEQRGVEAVTMDEIASAAGVAKGTLYLYFEGKEDLVQALMAQVGEDILDDVQRVAQTAELPEEKLRRVIALLLGHMERERVLFPIYVRDLMRWGKHGKGRWRHLWDLDEQVTGLITQIFAEGMAAGRFIAADPRLLAFLFRGMIRAVGFFQMVEGQHDVVNEALPILNKLLASGLAPQSDATEVTAP
jgi:AcrR family transcriptional regulator